MKNKLFILLVIVNALALSGCSFFDRLTSSDDVSLGPWSGEKQELTYTQKDLTKAHFYNVDYMPTTGNPKLLVLPILFNDSDDFMTEVERTNVLERLEKVCFGDADDTGWYSISSFYEAESLGKCLIEGEVADWYESGYSYDSVNSNVTQTIVKNAVNRWKSLNPEKIADFDTDNNGYLDGVLAIYGGYNYSNIKKARGHHRSNDNMWAYTSWLETEKNITSPNPNVFIWASFDFMDNDNQGGMLIDGHTYIHEMGHVFGLDDYYDYADSDQVWAGGYSMQDYNVGGHDPYSLMDLGWVDPYVPSESTTITITPFESSGDVILLSSNFSSNSVYDEYILLELYSPTGVNEHDSTYLYMGNYRYPQGPNKAGIRIWHIDSRLIKVLSTKRIGDRVIVDRYEIKSTIDEGDDNMIVGPTNTTFDDSDAGYSYGSKVSALRKFRLLELIRKGDYSGSKTTEPLKNNYLFTTGDTFSLTDYYGCFPNITKLDNGKRFYWKVKINSVSSTSATITLTYEE